MQATQTAVNADRTSVSSGRNFRVQSCAFDALSEFYVLNPIPKGEHAQARNLLMMQRACGAIEGNRR